MAWIELARPSSFLIVVGGHERFFAVLRGANASLGLSGTFVQRASSSETCSNGFARSESDTLAALFARKLLLCRRRKSALV
eukprot:3886742-Pleurochrysis_carterae.AAC.2